MAGLAASRHRSTVSALRSPVLALLVAVLAACAGPSAPAQPTATVVRGDVSRTVSADGALSGVTPGAGSVLVVPFEESAAANIVAGQPVQVTFAAVPGLERDGSVLAVAPGGVNISGVTNYYVTVVLAAGDPRLRAGQTATAAVHTGSAHDVLVVPNAAVQRDGEGSYVRVPGADGKPVRTPFRPGVVGDETTEVRSGLTEGQQVLLPTAPTAPS
jgi:multidrug efflux pump subunit AcrA (membrane-fusion protein)